jgi:hypothetical protein
MADTPDDRDPDVPYREPAATYREIGRRKIAEARKMLEEAEILPRPFTDDDDDAAESSP